MTMPDLEALRHALLAWWEEHGRRESSQKPWMFTAKGAWPHRQDTLNPYPVWIAEGMLQKTQLQVVLPYWRRWMDAFPSVDALAAASLEQVRLQWQGLGYYSRARRLHEAAQRWQSVAGSSDLEAWMALPGIGRTTAAGILSSAFNAPEPILDGNVKRVLARLHLHRAERHEHALVLLSVLSAALEVASETAVVKGGGSCLANVRDPWTAKKG